MSTEKPYVILAPHVDDEVIGCWRLLDQGKVRGVSYFFNLSSERINESWDCSAKYGFEVLDGLYDVKPDDILLVPNIADYHPHHKHVNHMVRNVANRVYYYSVDMNVAMQVLPEFAQEQKKKDLMKLFPSQQELLRSTQKYYLFESLLETDWVQMRIKEDGLERVVMVKPE
jgi:LmbE family N-acetylglucosaminyl deacetylase